MSQLRTWGHIPLILLVSGVSFAAAQEEQWLQYCSAPEVSLPGIDVGWRQLEVTSRAPTGVELPDFETQGQLFAKWPTPMVPAGYLWIAVDRSGDPGLYDQLYIDTDGDGHLDDETAVPNRLMTQYNVFFGPVKVVFQIEDGPVSYHLNLRFYSSGDRQSVYYSSGGWYEGPITVGGAKMACVLWDGNTNGAFDDTSLDSSESDRIQIKQNKNPVTLFVGRYLDVGGTLYQPEIARDGAYVKLSPAADVPRGRLRVGPGVTTVSAGGENGLFVLTPEDGICSLPAGTYRTYEWTVARKDDDGKNWRLVGRGASRADSFDVTEGEVTELAIGEPVVATLKANRGKGAYSFQQSLRGKDGEYIELTCNGSRPPAPRLRIKNKEGTYDRTYSFAYG